MIDCTFELNNKPMSVFRCGATSFPAFSGLGKHVNRRASVCIPSEGPIPSGHYCIFDRQVGGLSGPFDRLFGERRDWSASLWEIAIKSGLRRKDFRIDPGALMAALRDSGFLELPITAVHAVGVAELPAIHKDPFDRLLVAQSMAEPMTLLTNDATLGDYWDGVKVV